jgi:osmotically-inducible protein OsmY
MISQSPTDGSGHDRSRESAEAATDCLRRSPYCPIRSVSCECRQGVLFLRGRLPTFYLKQLAQEAVARVKGISQIVNETVVDASLLSEVRNIATGFSVSRLWRYANGGSP